MQTERILPLDFEWLRTKAERKKPIRKVGYHLDGAASAKRKFDDSFIAHLRWLHEDKNKTTQEISNAYPEISFTYLRDILSYTMRHRVEKSPCNLYMRDV